MAWLRKKAKKNGGYVYHIVFDINGKTRYKSTSTDDEKLANAILEKFNAELTLEKFGIKRIDSLGINKNRRKKLNDFINEHYQARKHYKEKTRKVDEYCFSNFYDFTGNVYLDEINKFNVEQYKSHRIKSVSPTTVNIEIRTLKAAFYYALKLNYINENPFSKSKKLKSKEEYLPEFLEIPEIESIRKTIDEYCDSEFSRCFEFYLNTGARRLEGLKTTWQDINFDEYLIFLRHTKTGKTRMVPMNQNLEEILKEMNKENQEGYLFNYHPDTLTHKFKKYLRKSDVKKDLHFHNLRDTFASHLIMQSVDLLTVSKYLGHSDVKVTEKYYGHLSPGHYRDSINKLPY